MAVDASLFSSRLLSPGSEFPVSGLKAVVAKSVVLVSLRWVVPLASINVEKMPLYPCLRVFRVM